MRIAVVDDDYTALTIISDYLKDEGYDVVKAFDPDELQDVESFDVIIMDVMIAPDRTKGIRYIRDLAKKKVITRDKLVIFITNFGREYEEIPNLLEEVGKYIDFEFYDKGFDISFFQTLRQKIEKHQ
jgi:DNA-binding response OmpR family regulator